MSEQREIRFSREFVQKFKGLQKTYRQIEDDLHPLLDQLRNGETPGEQIPGVGRPVYKVRLTNRSAKSGKRGGFRVLYYLQTASSIYLITVYSKTKRENIGVNEIKRLLNEVDETPNQPPDNP